MSNQLIPNNYHMLNIDYPSNVTVIISHILYHCTLVITWESRFYFPFFTDEKKKEAEDLD